jgi:hypothetical protein
VEYAGGIGGRTPNLQNRTAADGTVHPCPVPGATVFDTNSPVGDRPFLPFGIPTVFPPGPKPIFGSSSATAYGGTLSINDTILKLNPTTQLPHLLVLPPNALHPYQSAEAFRKIFPNVTTVSHNFAVWVTIGYFEVEADIPIDPIIAPGIVFHRLGREYFREVPGDTRHQFFAIVDRSMIAIEPASYLAFRSGGGSLQHAQQRPFFTTLQANAPAGSNTIAIYAPLDTPRWSRLERRAGGADHHGTTAGHRYRAGDGDRNGESGRSAASGWHGGRDVGRTAELHPSRRRLCLQRGARQPGSATQL